MGIQVGKTMAVVAVSGMIAGLTACGSAPPASPEMPAAPAADPAAAAPAADPAAAAPADPAAAAPGADPAKNGCKSQNGCKGEKKAP